MSKICREAEGSIDYYSLFKAIMKRTPLPMSPLESLASSAVRTAHKVQASLVVVLTRGGSTARLVSRLVGDWGAGRRSLHGTQSLGQAGSSGGGGGGGSSSSSRVPYEPGPL